ncbi:prestin-like isoform X2 [Varroa jacobsoni]|uniref:prestin-like isoform X2 n=1 Tax=Varroa jacobsoni TaxID=62625 RepID=UPI000BF62357|nr:prestin-like isoform X2 [Varroa jacobsoni]
MSNNGITDPRNGEGKCNHNGGDETDRRHNFIQRDIKKLCKCSSVSMGTPTRRSAFNQPHFDICSHAIKEKSSKADIVKKYAKQKFSLKKLKSSLLTFFPISNWIRNYNLRTDLVPDIICGLTVAIFHVPQTLGYALIVGVPAINGLYTAMYPMLMYAIFGTSRHNSIGALAVICIISSKVVQTSRSSFSDISPIDVARTLAFFAGIFQLLFGCLHMGSLSVFLSDQFVSGFTAGVSVHIGSSQLHGLGFNVSKHTGAFPLIRTYTDLFKNLGDTHWQTLVFSVIIILIILAVKILIDPYLLKKFHMPLPIEMIVLVLSVILSNTMDLKQHGFDVVKTIPNSVQKPTIPVLRIELINFILVDAVLVAIVSFTIGVSLGRIWARERGYEIQPNQEFFALGISNFCGSLCGCFPVGASVPRSSLQFLAAGRTQLASFINSGVILFVILVMGKFLEGLPVATLSAIIIVSLKKIFMQVRDFKSFWNLSIIDGHVWLVSFFATVILDTVYGLLIGILFSLGTLVYKVQRPKTFLLGEIANSEYYVPIKFCANAREIPGVKIFQYGGPLHFANAEFFRTELIRKCGTEYGILYNQARTMQLPHPIGRQISQKQTRYIILDFSRVTFVDGSSALLLKQIIDSMKSRRITIFIASCSPYIFSVLKKAELSEVILDTDFYPTVHDAVMNTHVSYTRSSGQPNRHRRFLTSDRMVLSNEAFGPDSLHTDDHAHESEEDEHNLSPNSDRAKAAVRVMTD